MQHQIIVVPFSCSFRGKILGSKSCFHSKKKAIHSLEITALEVSPEVGGLSAQLPLIQWIYENESSIVWFIIINRHGIDGRIICIVMIWNNTHKSAHVRKRSLVLALRHLLLRHSTYGRWRTWYVKQDVEADQLWASYSQSYWLATKCTRPKYQRLMTRSCLQSLPAIHGSAAAVTKRVSSKWWLFSDRWKGILSIYWCYVSADC